jgi:CubicO group peptidase (beta-lactamase class C family)
MKILVALLIALFSMTSVCAQNVLTAEESDPQRLGWMQGFPPEKEKILSAIDGSFFRFPALRYSVCHMREFMPTTVVNAALEERYNFPLALDSHIDSITFQPWNSEARMTWKESLARNYTDGMLILHRGRIVYEKYFGALKPQGVHAAMSVSKTFTGTLAALLIEEGVLDADKKGVDYIPELAGSAFADATIREILDMTTALQYSEDYADPKAEIWTFSAAGNPFPKAPGYTGPGNYYEYLVTVKKNGEHGQVFAYKTVNTDVMAWIIARVSGKTLPVLLSERIWQPMGANVDGYFQIDAAGIAFAGGGLSANLRDMGMFGEMIRRKGEFNRRQILPVAVIEDIMAGGNQEAFRKSVYATALPEWSYRNMWWITHNDNGAFAARGVHGQTVYIDPKAEMVIVRFASHPQAKNARIDPTSLPAYQAVAAYLLRR